MDRKDEQIAQLKELVEKLSAELKELTEAASPIGCIVHVGKERCQMVTSSGLLSIPTPKKKVLKAGMIVRLQGETMQPVEATELGDFGAVAEVAKVKESHVYVNIGGAEKVLLRAIPDELKEGSRVLLDPTGNVIVKLLEQAQEEFDLNSDLGISFDDIVGNDRAKQELIEAIDFQTDKSSVIKAYGYKPPKGLMFSGPPGCGKTMLAKATATYVSRKHGRNVSGGFISVKGPQVLDPYVGVAEATVRGLFARARAFKNKHGIPAILFIDEADAILGTRGDRFSHMEKTIVPSFLAEMDGLQESAAIVILATNRPEMLDPAITREGRIDFKIKVARPTVDEARKLLQMKFSKMPVALDCSELAKIGVHQLWSGRRQISEIEFQDGSRMLNLSDLVSGAMVDQVAESAKRFALRRDMEKGRVKGITEQDIVQAVDEIFVGNLDVDHRQVIMDLSEGKQITNVRNMNYAAVV